MTIGQKVRDMADVITGRFQLRPTPPNIETASVSPGVFTRGMDLYEAGGVLSVVEIVGGWVAVVAGISESFYATVYQDGEWSCPCQATVTCKHIVAMAAALYQ